jgi:plasmid stabilization system protein ParE
MSESDRKYSYKITSQAEADLDAIYGYIAGVFFSIETAEKAIDRISHAIRRLQEMPYLAPLTDEPEYAALEIHKLVAEQYDVFTL